MRGDCLPEPGAGIRAPFRIRGENGSMDGAPKHWTAAGQCWLCRTGEYVHLGQSSITGKESFKKKWGMWIISPYFGSKPFCSANTCTVGGSGTIQGSDFQALYCAGWPKSQCAPIAYAQHQISEKQQPLLHMSWPDSVSTAYVPARHSARAPTYSSPYWACTRCEQC